MLNQQIIAYEAVDKVERSPIVFDSPHSGQTLPDDFKFTCDISDLGYLPDLYVNRLLSDIPSHGSPVLESKISRVCIDLNRPEAELDPTTVRDGWAHPTKETNNTKSGFGLLPRYIRHPEGHFVDIFDEDTRPTAQEVEHRIAAYHRPYYATLENLLGQAHDQHGFAIHCNMHSMRRRSDKEDPHLKHIDLVLGDLRGASCAPELTQFAKSFFENEGLIVSLNDPYQGGNLVRATAAPGNGYHSLQIEVMRDLYMDQVTLEYKPERAQILQGIFTRFSSALQEFALEHKHVFTPAAAPPSRDVAVKHPAPSPQ